MRIKTIASVLLLLLLSSCGTQESSVLPMQSEVFTLKREMIVETLELSGTLEATKETPVAAKVSGRIANLSVDIGDTVKAASLLGNLAGDESAVNASTARLNEINMQNSYISQKQLLDAQLQNAQKAWELAQINLKAVTTSQGDTKLSTAEQVKLAEKQLEQAETQVINTQNLANQRISTLYKNARSAIRSGLMAVSSANDFADTILGVSKEKENANSVYKDSIGATSASSKDAAKNTLRISLTKKNDFKNLYDTSIEPRDPTNDEYDQYLQVALDSLESTQMMLNQLYTTLDHSIVSTNFSQSQLDSLKQENMLLGQNVEAAILTVSGGVKLGVKGVMLSKDEILTQNQAEKSSAEKTLAQVQQALNQIKAGSSQSVSSVQSQKNIAEKQLEQAKTALESAKAQKDSSLKELTQQLDLVKGNTRLSEVGLQDTQLIAPFSGVITAKFGEVGQVVAAGQPIFSVADTSAFKIKTDVPDTSLKNIHEGMEAEIKLDGVDSTWRAFISKVYPKVDPVTRKLGVELTLKDKPKDAKIGMFARITIKFPKKEAYFVPKSFVFSDYSGPYVILKNAEKKKVNTGIERGNEIKIWFEGEMEGKVITNK